MHINVDLCPECIANLLDALTPQPADSPGPVRHIRAASPGPVRHINEAGLRIIKDSEGCRLRAYTCPAGVWTIGYGHTRGVRPNDVCTERQAEEWLRKDCEDAERAVERLAKVPLTDNQFSALVSFAFNVGADEDDDDLAEGLGDSTLLKKLNQGLYGQVPGEMTKWVKGGGRKLDGLVIRREKEAMLWDAK